MSKWIAIHSKGPDDTMLEEIAVDDTIVGLVTKIMEQWEEVGPQLMSDPLQTIDISYDREHE